MINSTFGALFGGTMRGVHRGFDCRASFSITPPNFWAGGGSCFPLMVVVALGEPGTPVTCYAVARLDASIASRQCSRLQLSGRVPDRRLGGHRRIFIWRLTPLVPR